MPPRLFNTAGGPRRPQRRRSLVASAKNLDLTKRSMSYDRKGVPVWQEQAWTFFDQIGEVRYGARYYGNSLSRLRFYIGWRESASEPVTPINIDEPPAGLDRQQYDLAVNTLSRLHSTDGSVAELLRAYGVNVFVAGEGYLVGRVNPDTDSEQWEFLSVDQVIWHEQQWKLRNSPNDSPDRYVALDPESDVVIRVWLPHPRFSNEADSPMRAVLTICEELLLLSASVRASALSRVPAGILLMPDTMLEGGPDTVIEGDGTDGEAVADRTLNDIVEHFITPIADPESASAVVPHILTGDPQDLAQVRLIEPSRQVDQVAASQRAELLVRLANGVDLPPEVLQGMGNTNHWSAWLIDEQSFRTHIAPAAQLFANALTEGLIWSALRSSGASVDERLVVGFDAADLVTHPDRKNNAKDGHASLVISDEAYRRALGFADEDAPDEEEYVRRVALTQGALQLSPVAAGEIDSVVESIEVVNNSSAAPSSTLVEGDDDVSADEVTEVVTGPPVETVTAALRPNSEFGDLIGKLDRRLFDRIEAATSAALDRALEKAGARLRSKLARSADYRDLALTTPPALLAATLGQDVVRGFGIEEEELIQDEFEELAALFLLLTDKTQKRVRNELTRRYGLSDAESLALETKQEVDRENGKVSLIAGLTTAALIALYNPRPEAPSVGEFDPTSRVPASLIRDTLTVAGGGAPEAVLPGAPINVISPGLVDGRDVPLPTAEQDVVKPNPQPQGLVAGGATVSEAAAKVGLIQTGFIWNYGDELRQTFEPHFALDGGEYSGFGDAALVNVDSWPEGNYFFPGDHDGCRCSLVPIYSAMVVGEDEETEETEDNNDGSTDFFLGVNQPLKVKFFHARPGDHPVTVSGEDRVEEIKNDSQLATMGETPRVLAGGNDPMLEEIAARQGFDGPPRVVSSDTLDDRIANEGWIEMHRGVSTPEFAEQFRSGAYFGGQGVRGSGSYTSTNQKEALGYAKGDESATLRMALDPEARVIDSREAADRSLEAMQTASGGMRELLYDEGRWAAAAGYDALRVERTDIDGEPRTHYVVLNRTALLVEEAK
jgi:hypothetical protein